MVTAQEAKELHLEKDPKKHEILLDKLKHKIYDNMWEMGNDLKNIIFNILYVPRSQLQPYITIYVPENDNHWNEILNHLREYGYTVKVVGKNEKFKYDMFIIGWY